MAYAKQLEAAGADALELNMFFPPTDFKQNRVDRESIYFKVTEQVTQQLSIPTALKISHYFTDLGPMIQRLSQHRYRRSGAVQPLLQPGHRYRYIRGHQFLCIQHPIRPGHVVALGGHHGRKGRLRPGRFHRYPRRGCGDQAVAGRCRCGSGGLMPLQKWRCLFGKDAERIGELDVSQGVQADQQFQGKNEPGQEHGPVHIRAGAVHEVLWREKATMYPTPRSAFLSPARPAM
jgi:hypothetical protein